MPATLEKPDLEDIGTRSEVCHVAGDDLPNGEGTRTLCGEIVDEGPCCYGAKPCGRPPCEKCHEILDKL